MVIALSQGTPKRLPVLVVLAVRKITITRLAFVCGYSRAYIYDVLNGRVPLTQGVRERIATALGLSEEELFADVR